MTRNQIKFDLFEAAASGDNKTAETRGAAYERFTMETTSTASNLRYAQQLADAARRSGYSASETRSRVGRVALVCAIAAACLIVSTVAFVVIDSGERESLFTATAAIVFSASVLIAGLIAAVSILSNAWAVETVARMKADEAVMSGNQ